MQDTKTSFQKNLKKVAEENYEEQSQKLGYIIIFRFFMLFLTIWPFLEWQGQSGLEYVLYVIGIGSLVTAGIEIYGAYSIWRVSGSLFQIYYYLEYVAVFMYETLVGTAAIYGIIVCNIKTGDNRDATCTPSIANIIVLIRYSISVSALLFGRRFGLPLKKNLINLDIDVSGDMNL